MNTNGTYLAIFLSDKASPRMAAWKALPDAERQQKVAAGIAAWRAWAEKHKGSIVTIGGPLGKTKRISAEGVEDASNAMGAYSVVRADSHEDAAVLFENHPHFTIFPGKSVEVMPVLPIPGT